MTTDPTPDVNSQSPDYAAHVASIVETATTLALKPGSSTSEFKATFIGGFLLPALLAAFDALPPLWASIIAGVAGLLYAALRTRFKGEAVAELHAFADTLAAHAAEREERAAATLAPLPKSEGFITPGLLAIAAAISAIVILFTGCMGSGLRLPKARVTYHSDFGSVSYDGKTLTTDFYGGEVAPGLSVEGGGKF